MYIINDNEIIQMVKKMKNILIVEDDVSIHNLIKELLLKENYRVIDAYSGTEALMMIEKEKINLILLDLMLPGITGDEIIKRINNIPIIVISAKISFEDKINSLLNGADDYITKPFNNDELLVRIKVRLRNNRYVSEELIYKELHLLEDKHTLLISNNKVNLTKTEYAILKQLLLFPKEVISKNRLLDLISVDTLDCDENSLKVHISNLKKKIKKYTDNKYIESIWGIGYKIYDE